MDAASVPVSDAGLELMDLRERLTWAGPAALVDAECLALALRRVAGCAAPDLARRLLARFGSLPQVLGAPGPDLRQVAPARVAAEIELLHDLQRRTLATPFRQREVLGSITQVCAYLRAVMAAEPREQFRVLFLDKRNRLIADEVMGRGTVDHAPVYPREVVRRALELNASGAVLAHNHPSGDPSPSAADIDMTRQVVAAARALAVTVHDHMLVAGDVVASFRALGLM